jgi:hypothetical protein
VLRLLEWRSRFGRGFEDAEYREREYWVNGDCGRILGNGFTIWVEVVLLFNLVMQVVYDPDSVRVVI